MYKLRHIDGEREQQQNSEAILFYYLGTGLIICIKIYDWHFEDSASFYYLQISAFC